MKDLFRLKKWEKSTKFRSSQKNNMVRSILTQNKISTHIDPNLLHKRY